MILIGRGLDLSVYGKRKERIGEGAEKSERKVSVSKGKREKRKQNGSEERKRNTEVKAKPRTSESELCSFQGVSKRECEQVSGSKRSK